MIFFITFFLFHSCNVVIRDFFRRLIGFVRNRMIRDALHLFFLFRRGTRSCFIRYHDKPRGQMAYVVSPFDREDLINGFSMYAI